MQIANSDCCYLKIGWYRLHYDSPKKTQQLVAMERSMYLFIMSLPICCKKLCMGVDIFETEIDLNFDLAGKIIVIHTRDGKDYNKKVSSLHSIFYHDLLFLNIDGINYLFCVLCTLPFCASQN